MSRPDAIFVDSVYLIARRSSRDNWRTAAQAAAKDLVPRQQLLTSDGVILETLAHFSRESRSLRISLARDMRAMKSDPSYTVVTHNAELMTAALDLYGGEFADSSFSLQDCVAIQVMREYGVISILTADQEFARAGFTPLLRRYI